MHRPMSRTSVMSDIPSTALPQLGITCAAAQILEQSKDRGFNPIRDFMDFPVTLNGRSSHVSVSKVSVTSWTSR